MYVLSNHVCECICDLFFLIMHIKAIENQKVEKQKSLDEYYIKSFETSFVHPNYFDICKDAESDGYNKSEIKKLLDRAYENYKLEK